MYEQYTNMFMFYVMKSIVASRFESEPLVGILTFYQKSNSKFQYVKYQSSERLSEFLHSNIINWRSMTEKFD